MKFDFKPAGLKRRVDNVGRVVAPKEFREISGMEPGDVVDIFCDKHGNILIMPEEKK